MTVVTRGASVKSKHTINTYDKLQAILKPRIITAQKPIAIIAGHYRLNQKGEPAFNPCDEGSFGAFSRTTLNLGIKLLQVAREYKKEAKLVALVDDHSAQKDKQWYMHSDVEANKIRRRIEKSLKLIEVHPDFLYQLERNGFDKNILQASKKFDNIFQESYYREQFAKETGLDPGCSGEYRLILEELSQLGFSLVISYVPVVCQAPTCTALGYYNKTKTNKPLSISQVYFSSRREDDTPELMLEHTVKQYGGIRIINQK